MTGHWSDGPWDLVIVGGGPAGLMAAISARLVHPDICILILEKNGRLGEKLRISGGGRCNFTNVAQGRHLTDAYGDDGRYLHGLFARFSSNDCLAFFQERGMEWKVENEGRAFPQSDSSESVLHVLVEGAKHPETRIVQGAEVAELRVEDQRVVGVTFTMGPKSYTISCPRVILATGGTSHPETGSTGDGFRFLDRLGLPIRWPDPSLVPLVTDVTASAPLQGLALPWVKVRVSAGIQGKTLHRFEGKILFTHFGLSGPGILNNSRRIVELDEALSQSATVVVLHLNFVPGVDPALLDRTLSQLAQDHGALQIPKLLVKALEIVAPDLSLPIKLIRWVVEQAGCQKAGRAATLSAGERKALVHNCCSWPTEFRGTMGESWAIISRGGLHPDGVNMKTMAVRSIDGLWVVGDLLDINRRSGGYSLQLCWASGWVAGQDAGLGLSKG